MYPALYGQSKRAASYTPIERRRSLNAIYLSKGVLDINLSIVLDHTIQAIQHQYPVASSAPKVMI